MIGGFHGKLEQPVICDSKRGLAEILLRVEGTVQGVGFRPFVYRLAHLLRVCGWVLNDSSGVLIRARAPRGTLAGFEAAIEEEAPPAARIECVLRLDFHEYPDLAGVSNDFVILDSEHRSAVDAAMPADVAVCADCLQEMRDPANRRYRYPFINCTNCGPRYSIIEGIPCDRSNTTMREFELCPGCRAEYENPRDRRFHAQPLACSNCGPALAFRGACGNPVADGEEALHIAMAEIRAGKIIAVKGIGGFHLMCDARNARAVNALRRRKRREGKPFALMLRDLEMARGLCVLSTEEEALLGSRMAPIVLAERIARTAATLCEAVAPENPLLGIMLPYAPLHHLMFEEWGGALVATSGNISEEPICIDERDALERLRGIADGFLVHNRPIARPVDDSVVRFIQGGPVVFRRARGYAPTPILQHESLSPVLAVGAHLKNTVAVTVGSRVFPSQHLGDLTTRAGCDAFADAIHTLVQLYPAHPEAIVCDLHPDYHSSVWASRQKLPVIRVQHHHAHVLSCMAEHQMEGPVTGVSWDGSGYGPDKTIWGGEWLVAPDRGVSFQRLAHLRTFPLPGGESAIHRPAFTALSLLWEIMGEEAFCKRKAPSLCGLPENEIRILGRMLSQKLHTPLTSSAGRLFDGVAALLGLGARSAFEAQVAMKLEFAAMRSKDTGSYDFELREPESSPSGSQAEPVVIDWEPMLRGILKDLGRSIETAVIARRFHNTLAEMICAGARKMPGLPVVLTGGCFQNKLLTESAVLRLRRNGFDVHWHQGIPPNDNGISVGQALAGGARNTSPNPKTNFQTSISRSCA
ncbi:MAG: carbamoyltransferase HypF [Opitutales bacterium]